MPMVDPAVWQRIIERVVSAAGQIIRPWFTELEPVSLEHGVLEVQTPGTSERNYCARHATRLFTEAAQAATGRLISVVFVTPQEASQHQDDSTPAATAETDAPLLELNPDYTFETFVRGPSNRLAHAACLAVAESPGKSYNPLFIHGSVGLGKTHLLHATSRKVGEDLGDGQISVLSCETFVNHFITSVEQGDLHDFRYRYRHVDMLVIDDIQFLSDHEQSQEEFFHTFNTLYQSQKQIILSSDRSPSEIPGLEERLVSRFNWGLVARLDRPCYETRVAIVRKKARLRGMELPEDVVCYIAGSIESNIRELEGAIAKVAMLARVTDRDIDLSVAQDALGGEARPREREVSIEDILKAVTNCYDVRLADLQSKKRSRSIALPRQVCMYLARNFTRHSLEEIGGYFGGRDHSTVLHANRAVDSLREKNPEFRATLERLSQQIQLTQ
ncbi:MAG: chromosomal replication initiator protein DnaA [Phycisphaerae bacterium]